MNVTAEKISQLENAMTPRQYAERKGVSLKTAYDHIWQGKVQAEKLLDRWLIIEAGEEKPCPEIR